MKNFPILILIAAAFILISSTCRTLGVEDLDKMKPRIELRKGPCFGSCPVFKMTIYEGGLVAYDGERYTNRIGLHTKWLDAETYKSLIKTFDEADMWSFQNAYKAQIPDMATVSIVYHKGDNSKTVKGKDGRPAKIIELEKRLNTIAESSGWERQNATINQEIPNGAIGNELIVNLATDVDPAVWIIQFTRQEMNIVKRISPNSPYWLLRFNSNIMSPNEMLERVRRDPYVLSVEFNRKVNGSSRR